MIYFDTCLNHTEKQLASASFLNIFVNLSEPSTIFNEYDNEEWSTVVKRMSVCIVLLIDITDYRSIGMYVI